jgi:demethylmenaquinone methyltransferase/2-methoxy-6-polyprenyl-1,4-benzoquinol methylase
MQKINKNNLKKQKKYLKRWYNKTAEDYDRRGKEFNYGVELKGIKKLLDIKKGEFVLDVATGTGHYLILMAKKGPICYGIDISKRILNVAKRKVKKLKLNNVRELRIGDADKIPYPNSFFDWVTCIGLIEYYPIKHTKKILLEFRRVLKERGKIVLDFPDIKNKEAHEFKEKSESVKTNVYLYDFKKIKDMLIKLKFKILTKQIRGFEIQFLLQKL